MTPRRRLIIAPCLVAALCAVANVGRVIPVWSCLTLLVGVLQIGAREFSRSAMPRIQRICCGSTSSTSGA